MRALDPWPLSAGPLACAAVTDRGTFQSLESICSAGRLARGPQAPPRMCLLVPGNRAAIPGPLRAGPPWAPWPGGERVAVEARGRGRAGGMAATSSLVFPSPVLSLSGCVPLTPPFEGETRARAGDTVGVQRWPVGAGLPVPCLQHSQALRAAAGALAPPALLPTPFPAQPHLLSG